MQASIEGIKQDIGSKRKAAALDGAKKSKTIIKSKANKMTASCRQANVCSSILEKMTEQFDPLEAALRDSSDAFQGSEQERSALDKAYSAQDSIQKQLTDLQEQMIPAGYKTPVPDEYKDLPQLEGGRATVEMVFKKADGGPFRVEGKLYDKAEMKMIIDGFSCK